jgi:hypothetical protein
MQDHHQTEEFQSPSLGIESLLLSDSLSGSIVIVITMVSSVNAVVFDGPKGGRLLTCWCD